MSWYGRTVGLVLLLPFIMLGVVVALLIMAAEIAFVVVMGMLDFARSFPQEPEKNRKRGQPQPLPFNPLRPR